MNSILNAASLQFLNSVNQTQASLNRVENELSSGLAVTVPSDAPDEVSPLLQLHADIAQNTQIQANLNATQTAAQSADQGLSSAGTILNQVATLAAEGLGVTQTAADRQTLAAGVTSLLKQIVTISNTSSEGALVFAGDFGSANYSFDASTGTVTTLAPLTNTSTAQVQDGSGGSFAVGLSANQIFDARDANGPVASQNVFAAVTAVAAALSTNDTTGLQAAIGNISDVSAYVSQQQGFYANVESQVAASLDHVANLATSYQVELSSRRDADATSAILELQQYTTTLQAALAADAKRPQATLFDLLH